MVGVCLPAIWVYGRLRSATESTAPELAATRSISDQEYQRLGSSALAVLEDAGWGK